MQGAEEWAELFTGIEPVAALPGMGHRWLSGLSDNQPADVLVRLLGRVRGMALEPHPMEVVEAAIAHPDWKVRAEYAEFRRDMSLDQWVRLIASIPAGVRRLRFQGFAGWHCRRPTPAEFERWAADPDPQVRLRALWFRGLPGPVAAGLAADPDPEVRATACEQAWRQLDAGRRSALGADPAPEVRDAARKQLDRERPLSRAEFDALESLEQWFAPRDRRLDPELARELLAYQEYGWRAHLAENEWIGPELVAALAEDADERVRAHVAVRPEVDEELRARVTASLRADYPYWRVDWVEDLHGDAEAMRRLARSASVAVRRSVAHARRLPPDVLDLLSRDPDSGVRSNLVRHNEDASADLLLGAAVRWTHPAALLRRPDFPLDALRGFADDPDPMRRRLALDAPDSTAELAERLVGDPDERVRVRAARDPRLSPATVLRLLASTEADFLAGLATRGLPVPDTYRLRQAAIVNPRLPVDVLIGLLRDRETAQTAAANPAIPAAVAHRLIDLIDDVERRG